ncbi:MAG: TIR domain-containing protein, partial [Pseudomonadota bacterium]
MEKNKIFVCYRREDAAWTRSIYEKLEREFGENSVFMDVEAIAAGRNFEEVILASLRECFAAVVVIGPTWLDPAEGEEDSRLHDVNDYVHLEIFTCLAAGIRIIPVLVSGAKMPKPDLLPRNLRTLTKINARTIPTDDLFDHATSLLAGSLREAHAETRPQETVVVTPEVPPDRSRRWRTASLVLAAALMVVTGASGYYALTQTNQTGNTVLRYRQEINQLTAKLEVSEATAAQLKREIETLAAQRDGAQPQITELRTALTEKEKEIDRLG